MNRIRVAHVAAFLGFALAASPTPADADQPVTPSPAVAPAPGCVGNAAMSWNVASVPGADAIRWELRRGSDFPDPDRADRRSATGDGAGVSGIVVLDLRDHGPILNGEPYFVRIVALGGGNEVGRRSASVRFDPRQVYDDFQAAAGGGGATALELSWGGNGQFAGCLDGVLYELKRNTPFSNPTGAESGRLTSEAVPQTAGSRTVDLSSFGAGTYYVRVVGKFGGSSPDHDVGRRGPGIQVTVGAVATPTSTPTPTPTTTPTLTPTVPFTPTATPTVVVTPTPTFTPTFPPPTATYTPSYTPTTPPPVQTAPPDPNFNNPLNISLDSTASVLDFVSYPQGDTTDRVRWDISGMNPNPSLPGGRARLVIAVSCFGTGIEHVQFFTSGQTFSCGQTIVDREVTYDSRTGQVTITAVGGSGTYVQWVLTGTATRLNRSDGRLPGRDTIRRRNGGS